MSRQLLEEAQRVLRAEAAVKLDPVGQEDKDIDNDGDSDKTDNYLKKRRGAISAAIAKAKNESARPELSEEDSQRVSDILKGVQEEAEITESDDLGPVKKKQKTVMLVHKTSGREKVVVDTPKNREENARIGFLPAKKEEIEQVDEGNKENKEKKNKYVSSIIQKKVHPSVLPSLKYGRRELKKEEAEQVDEMQVANKYALKGPQPSEVPAYMRKGNARKQFPLKLDDLKRKDTMSDVENLRKMEEVDNDSVSEILETRDAFTIELPETLTYQDYLKAAMQAEGIESLKELDDETVMPFLSFVEQLFVEGQEEFVISELTYSELQEIGRAHV